MSLKPGKVLNDRYRIGAVLGEGGMGTVHLATHLALDQPVAIKVMSDAGSSPNAVHRFMREAKLAAKLRSEHVVHVLDFATTPAGAPYIVLEYLEGSDLQEIINRRGPIEVSVAVDWVLQALVAIGEAHAMGIVHRDLKPANLFLASLPDGEKLLKVMDFGISKSLVPDDDASEITHTSAIMGTPAYCAPEVLASARRASVRSDIFAMGAVLYQLLTATRPFDGTTIGEVIERVRAGNPTPPRELVPAIPSVLDGIILRCLASEPGARYADVGELAMALAPFASRPKLAKRVVRMLGDDVASERLQASITATDPTLPGAPDPNLRGSARDPTARLGDITLTPVGISTAVMEQGFRTAPSGSVSAGSFPSGSAGVSMEPPKPRRGIGAIAGVVTLLAAGAIVLVLVFESGRLPLGAREPSAAVTAASAAAAPPPPATPSATPVVLEPAPAGTTATAPPVVASAAATSSSAVAAASARGAVRRANAVVPSAKRAPSEPSDLGTEGFGGRH